MTHLVETTAIGAPFVVALEGVDAAEAERIAALWGWCGGRVVDRVGEGRQVLEARLASEPGVAEVADTPRLVAHSLAELEDRLTGFVTQRAIDARKNDLVLLHAGAVAHPQSGAVIAFVGPSGRGKTTASIALGSVFDYITDETVGVDDALVVLPYSKPLSVKLDAPARWKQQVAPVSLGLRRPAGAPLVLAGVVMLDRRTDLADGVEPIVQSIGFAEAVGELVPQVSYLPERGRPLQRLRVIIDRCGGLRRVTYAEAATLPALFARLFDDLAVPSEPSPTVLHSVFDDAVRDGDTLVVLTDRVVRVLAGIAPTLIERAVTGCTLAELTEAVLAAHGVPPAGTAEELVARAVDELTAVGLLRVAGES